MAFAPMFWVAKNLAITGAGPLRDPYQIGSHEAAVADNGAIPCFDLACLKLPNIQVLMDNGMIVGPAAGASWR